MELLEIVLKEIDKKKFSIIQLNVVQINYSQGTMFNSIPEYLWVRITESKAESMSYVSAIYLYKMFRDSVF